MVLPGQQQLDNTRTFSEISGKRQSQRDPASQLCQTRRSTVNMLAKKIILKPQSNSIGETINEAPTM
jgi:hypothetical protein